MASMALREAVPEAAKSILRSAVRRNGNTTTGVVISAGLAEKTVKVRVGGEVWNKKVQKYFKKPEKHLVHDPNNSLRTGDVVEILSGWRTSKNKRFIVNRIIAPFGPPIEARPPVPTAEEREREHALGVKEKKERKFLTHSTERLTKKLQQAEAVTKGIMETAVMMQLIKELPVEWRPKPVVETATGKTKPARTGKKLTGKERNAKAKAKKEKRATGTATGT